MTLGCTAAEGLLRTLEASRETLKIIRFGFQEDVSRENYIRIWRMRFPLLHVLAVTHPSTSLDGTTEFILAHEDKLEELDYSLAFDKPKLLKRDSLPKLKKYKGNIRPFCQMLDARLDCLVTSLERLEISPRSVLSPLFPLFGFLSPMLYIT